MCILKIQCCRININICGFIYQLYRLQQNHWLPDAMRSTSSSNDRWYLEELGNSLINSIGQVTIGPRASSAFVSYQFFACNDSITRRPMVGVFLTEMLVRSPCVWFFFILRKYIFWIKVSKKCFVYFWKGNTALGMRTGLRPNFTKQMSLDIFKNRRTSNHWIAWGEKTSVYRGTRGSRRSACGPNENLKELLSFVDNTQHP